MKNMQKKTLLVLCTIILTMLFASVLGIATAQAAEYSTTKAFLDLLDQKSIKYTYYGVDNGSEILQTTFSMDHFDSAKVTIIFDEDCDSVSLRMWNILTTSAGKNFILSSLADINNEYKYVKFVYDESDSSVQCEIDMYIDAHACAQPVWDALVTMIVCVDSDGVAEKLHLLE